MSYHRDTERVLCGGGAVFTRNCRSLRLVNDGDMAAVERVMYEVVTTPVTKVTYHQLMLPIPED